MRKIVQYESDDFTADKVRELKRGKKIFVVFSTFGEREAELIHQKISLLRREAGDIIDRILLSHRRAGAVPELTEEKAKAAWADTDVVICNSLPVPDMGDEKGKGADMRRCLYHINTRRAKGISDKDIVVVFLDADVAPAHFGAHFVRGLAGAVLHGHDFAKAGFWRAMGRVKKYVAQPLFSVVRHHALENLADFSYPLSGEVAGTLSFFNRVHFWQMYGVETGINIESVIENFSIADVNLGLYDHEHHNDVAIQRMAFGIMRTYITQLRDYGIIELKEGAAISDIFRASFIDTNGERSSMEFDLRENKYAPLRDIL